MRASSPSIPTIVAVAALLPLSLACTSSDGKKSPASATASQDAGDAEPPRPNAVAAVSSVVMIGDCPHQDSAGPPPPPKPVAPSRAADEPQEAAGAMDPQMQQERSAGDSLDDRGSFDDCEQSTMQLVLRGTTGEPAKVSIAAARLLRADTSAKVGDVEARKPTFWSTDGRYWQWDETVPAGQEIKASYKLSDPKWSAVDNALGKNSVGAMFVLEVDVDIDGQRQSIRSPQFARQEQHQIAT